MTEEAKFNRFLDAQEHPEKYSEKELQEVLQEGDDFAKLKSALMEERASDADLDLDAEWKKFSNEHECKTTGNRWIRIAAMFIGFVFIAGVAFAAMTHLGIISNPFVKNETAVLDTTKADPKKEADKVIKVNNDTITQLPKAEPAKPVTKVFDNATLVGIMQEIGNYYNVEVVFSNNDAKTIRLYFEWNQSKSLDENIAILNSFNQIVITRQDNTLLVE